MVILSISTKLGWATQSHRMRIPDDLKGMQQGAAQHVLGCPGWCHVSSGAAWAARLPRPHSGTASPRQPTETSPLSNPPPPLVLPLLFPLLVVQSSIANVLKEEPHLSITVAMCSGSPSPSSSVLPAPPPAGPACADAAPEALLLPCPCSSAGGRSRRPSHGRRQTWQGTVHTRRTRATGACRTCHRRSTSFGARGRGRPA